LERTPNIWCRSRLAQRKRRPDLAGLTQVVEAYEAVNKEFDITQKRWWSTTFAGQRRPAQPAQSLGLRVEMGAFRWVTSSDPKVVAGPPFRTIFDHWHPVGIHGDGVHIAPLNPWLHIYYATTGVNSFDDKVNGDQQAHAR